ncbi:hypothetical protein [Saccharopolyspora sp. 6V]|uniref:hypothetical protein n=1 Tax=Saccharopolyspora sp. 6V TaxID=2877239 RepID=UPI001CD3FC72|nr:hypothetical protein [Saccharopolyspora sp. 6V]MCA1191665.1 hypothetical protein [Saccharopolyspora sp. 6V]
MTTLADLEARIAALEASQADYRAVLAAVNALGANQRDHADQLRVVEVGQERLARSHDDTNARVRSIEESVSEIKDLLVRALDR